MKLFFGFFAVILFFILPSNSLACDCGHIKPAKQALASATAVFYGMVLAVEKETNPDSRLVLIDVRRTWKE